MSILKKNYKVIIPIRDYLELHVPVSTLQFYDFTAIALYSGEFYPLCPGNNICPGH